MKNTKNTIFSIFCCVVCILFAGVRGQKSTWRYGGEGTCVKAKAWHARGELGLLRRWGLLAARVSALIWAGY
ncbi:hypothetical protein V6Z12_D01G100000 [Gossypium hirsutum]